MRKSLSVIFGREIGEGASSLFFRFLDFFLDLR
jgi:hypothetical protein